MTNSFFTSVTDQAMRLLRHLVAYAAVVALGSPGPVYGAPHSYSNETSPSLDHDAELFGPAALNRRQNLPELRIMPLGASIVYGVGSEASGGNGFRKLLRDQARTAGYPVNMVGTKKGGTMKDNDCEATSGYIVTEIHNEAKKSFKFKPNVVVINAGTNDCVRFIDNGNQHNRLRAIIEDIWASVSTDTVIIVSTLLPLGGQAGDVRNTVNNNYRQMVRDLASQGRSIYLADMDSITMGELPDGVHPAEPGFRKMAAAFWAGIQAAQRDGRIKAPLPMAPEAGGGNSGDNECKKPAGNGIYAGGLTQRGSGEHDGIYKHASEAMGVALTVTSDFDRDQWFFARLFRQDRDDLLGWFDQADGSVRYGVWRNDGGGKFTKIGDLNVQDNCIPRGIAFIDINADGLDDFTCTGPDGNVYASVNLGTGGGANPPSFRSIGLWKAAVAGYPQARVRLVDIDGDGRADFCGMAGNGDAYCWRNGGVKDKPEYWQALGRRFEGKGMGDLAGVRFEDINGDGRDDWLWVSDNGQTTTWTNSRSCFRGSEGDGLNVAWRQGFNGDSTSGPTHPGGFGTGARNRIHFARIYGEPQAFGLLGRQDYVFMEHVKDGAKHKFNMRVFKNKGYGGTKVVADGNKYADMTGNGREDYVWTHSTGVMTMFPNAGKTTISGTESFWGPSVKIFEPRSYVGRDLDRRDLHLVDWDGDGRADIVWVNPDNQNRVSVFRNLGGWRWEYQANPAPVLYCPEKRGLGVFDLSVRFADITGSGRADYLCIEKDGRVWGWTQAANGAWTYMDQIKSAKGHDRANLRWADVNGDGRADTIWIDKFNGDGHVYYNLGRADVGGSRFHWETKPGGGPFHAYGGQRAGSCTYFPDLDGNRRADLHCLKGTFTNEAETWWNTCNGGDATGDDPNMGNPGLPPVALPPTPGQGGGGGGGGGGDLPGNEYPEPPWALPGPGTPSTMQPPPLSENCGFSVNRPFPDFFATPRAIGGQGGTFRCLGKWNRGVFPAEIYAVASERMLRYMEITYSDGTVDKVGTNIPERDRTGRIKWDSVYEPFTRFNIVGGGWNDAVGRLLIDNEAACKRDRNYCHLDAGMWYNVRPSPEGDPVPRGTRDEGMLLGFEAREGDGIDLLQPYFSNSRTESVTMENFFFEPSFDQINERPFAQRGLTVVEAIFDVFNDFPDRNLLLIHGVTLSVEHGTKTVGSWESGREIGGEGAITVGTTYKARVGIPWFTKYDGEVKLEAQGKFIYKNITKTVTTKEDMETKTVAIQDTVRVDVKPLERVRCRSIILQSNVDVGYTATLEHKFLSGKSYKYPTEGRYQNSASSQVITRCGVLKSDDPAPDYVLRASTSQNSLHCPGGKRAGSISMSSTDYERACGMPLVDVYSASYNM